MKYLGYLLGPLGCALGMVVCMVMMARGNRRRATDPGPEEAGEGTAAGPATPDPGSERTAASDA
jgi:hypothetical protein